MTAKITSATIRRANEVRAIFCIPWALRICFLSTNYQPQYATKGPLKELWKIQQRERAPQRAHVDKLCTGRKRAMISTYGANQLMPIAVAVVKTLH
jgi:hypothetical protein